jgi:pimeloyl-ACP methyl ester carboxylesterase
MRVRAIVAVVLFGAALLAWWSSRAFTPPVRSADGRVVPDSVASLEKIRIGGVDQWILARGRSRRNPVLLFLHGGPGMPAMYLAHAFQRELEDSFTVVHWDRRGAGKSYSKRIPGASLSVSNQLADTIELVRILRDHFGQSRIYLLGHSWGSLLGLIAVARHPELFDAYIGVGQVVDDNQARKVQLEFVEREARARGDREALEEIARGPGSLEKYLFRYGAELTGATSWWPLLGIGLRAPEYSFWDSMKVPRGVSFSHAHTRDDVLFGRAPREAVKALELPAWFFAGRRDYATPSALVARYVEELAAPRKELVWFEHSAHFPFLEEPARFAAEMRRVRADAEGRGQRSSPGDVRPALEARPASSP